MVYLHTLNYLGSEMVDPLGSDGPWVIHKRCKFFFLDWLTHTQEKQPTWKQLSNNTWDDHSVTSIPQPFPTMN